MRTTRAGFTLFEVGVSLLIMGVAVTSVLVLLPTGIQAQQNVRYQFLAASKLQGLVGMVTSPATLDEGVMWHEAENLADGSVINAKAYSPDLEAYTNSMTEGCGIALPHEIARRLDSDHDQIATILSQGGNIYYTPPGGVDAWDSGGQAILPVVQASDFALRRLVFGFIGYPQQNLLTHHPQIAWPYPQHQPSLGMKWEQSVWANPVLPPLPAIPAMTPSDPNDHTSTSTALTTLGFAVPLGAIPDRAAMIAWDLANPGKLAIACIALRNHARATLRKAGGLLAGNPFEAEARTANEWMMRFIMYAKSDHPYDCRVPQIASHLLMTDVPLLHYDLFAPPATTAAYAVRRPSDPSWKCWQVLSEEQMAFPRSWSWDNAPTTDHTSGRFNATAPFDPAERCRQMVVWAVSWESYEDFEEVPSAPLDSARLSWIPTPYGEKRLHTRWCGRPPPEWLQVWNSPSRDSSLATTTWNLDDFHTHATPMHYFGRWGADRNLNYQFDRGNTKPSVRLRASTVARFNVYDARGYVVAR